MKTVKNFLPITGLVLGLLCGAEAQESERVYPFVELTDADLAQIDVTDGSVDEWVDLLGEPTLTALDFQTRPDLAPYDPADMDYRVWLAWHGATQRLYVAVERADDIYINTYEDDGTIHSCFLMFQHDSYVMFNVDGDASGGEYLFLEGLSPGARDDEDLRLRVNQHAQGYFVLGDIFGGGSHVCLYPQSLYNDEDWFQRPPYAEGGGTSFGEHPTLSVTEFYVTPFDRLIWNSPAESVVSTLSRGTLIGFILGIADHDEEGALLPEGWHFISAQDQQWTGTTNADTFARGLLVGPGGEIPDSAVESLTWGRIKATFVR